MLLSFVLFVIGFAGALFFGFGFNKRSIAIFCIVVGSVMVLDEIWMLHDIVPLVPTFGSPGWLMGDWSFMHVDPIHHWMLGVVMIVIGWRNLLR